MQHLLKFLFAIILNNSIGVRAEAQTWKKIYANPAPYGTCAAFNPLSHGRTIFCAGSATLTIARSDDGGASWKLYQIPKKPDTNILIHQLLCLEADTNIVFALGDGVFRSTNGGKTWANVLNIPSDDGETLIYHVASNTLYYSGSDTLAIWISSDHGAHWSEAPGKRGQSMVCTIAASPDAEPTILAGNGGGVLRSVDAGRSWQTVMADDSNETSKIIYAKSAPHTVLATSWYSKNRTLLLSTDDGITWKDLKTDPRWIWTIEIDPDPAKIKNGIPQHFWAGLLTADSVIHSHPDITETTDGGVTWKRHYLAYSSGHAWVWVLSYDSSSRTLLAATSIGLYTLKYTADITDAPDSYSPAPYPNPFTDRLSIPIPPDFTAPLELQVWDACGREQYRSSAQTPPATIEIDTHNWNSGLYIWMVTSESKTMRGKMVRE
jgi:hypothetical protein